VTPALSGFTARTISRYMDLGWEDNWAKNRELQEQVVTPMARRVDSRWRLFFALYLKITMLVFLKGMWGGRRR